MNTTDLAPPGAAADGIGHPLSRRGLLAWLPAAGVLALAPPARADDALLQESDPSARAVDYVADAAKVDRARFPKYAPGQTCANCSIYVGEAGQPAGGCQLFFGVQVAAKGWCSSWEPKAA